MSAALDFGLAAVRQCWPRSGSTRSRGFSSARETVSADRGLVHSRVRSTTYYVSFLGLYTTYGRRA